MSSSSSSRPVRRHPSELQLGHIPDYTSDQSIVYIEDDDDYRTDDQDSKQGNEVRSRIRESESESEQEEEEQQAELRRCWICHSDETEDDKPMVWRKPCPCQMTAHDVCLLDWIAGLEAPTSGTRLASTRVVKCPQCQYTITIDRPQSVVVRVVQTAVRTVRLLFLPAVAVAVAGPIYLGLASHGLWSVYTVFGFADAGPMVRSIRLSSAELAAVVGRDSLFGEVAGILRHVGQNWRLAVGLPLIPIVLVLNRTNLIDRYLPILPVIILANRGRLISHVVAESAIGYTTSPPSLSVRTPADVGPLWPPSPTVCFAMLPYVRAAYNWLYSYLWADLERQWLSEVQPRHQADPALADIGLDRIDRLDDADGELDRADFGLGDADGANVFQLGVEIGEGDGDDGDGADDPPIPGFPRWMLGRAGPDAVAADVAAEAAAADVLAGAPGNGRVNNNNNNNNNNNVVVRTSLMESVLGSLLFPAIAASAGELLRLVLPYAWTHMPRAGLGAMSASASASSFAVLGSVMGSVGLGSVYKAAASALATIGIGAGMGHPPGSPSGSGAGPVTGLLQLRWGRAVVGGCVAVLLKDSLMLYVRWRLAQAQRRRRVLDYVR